MTENPYQDAIVELQADVRALMSILVHVLLYLKRTHGVDLREMNRLTTAEERQEVAGVLGVRLPDRG